MTKDVFDPKLHRIVAVDGKGQHLHVELEEIARDARELVQPISDNDVRLLGQRLDAIEAQRGALIVSPAPAPEAGNAAVDISHLEAQMAQLARDDQTIATRIEDVASQVSALVAVLNLLKIVPEEAIRDALAQLQSEAA